MDPSVRRAGVKFFQRPLDQSLEEIARVRSPNLPQQKVHRGHWTTIGGTVHRLALIRTANPRQVLPHTTSNDREGGDTSLSLVVPTTRFFSAQHLQDPAAVVGSSCPAWRNGTQMAKERETVLLREPQSGRVESS